MKKIMAFTLAEILITLGVTGIVAAITMPTVLQNAYEKRTITTLKQTQSILSQAMRMAEEEYGEADGWNLEIGISGTEKDAITIANNLKPFLKIATDCGTSDLDGKCVPATYQLKNGTNVGDMHRKDTRYYKIVLLNGSAIWWRTGRENKRLITFFIDTNGKNKPNMWGKDLFAFSYYENSLKPLGAPDSDMPYETNCKSANSTGYGCAYHVIMFQNMNYLRNK